MHKPCKEIVYDFIRMRTRAHCEAIGHVCKHWVDGKILQDLRSLDLKDNGTRVNEYYERTHCVDVVMIPGTEFEDWKFKIKCHPFAIWRTESCDYSNEEAEKSMLKEFIEHSKEDGQNAPM